jgi:lipoate-protein ligase B
VDGTRKIAAIGIQVSGGVTSHGIALNCDTDLGWFDNVRFFFVFSANSNFFSKQKNFPVNSFSQCKKKTENPKIGVFQSFFTKFFCIHVPKKRRNQFRSFPVA